MLFRLGLLIAFLFLPLCHLKAQFTTEGKEFWVGFMQITPYDPFSQQLFITSSTATTGLVEVAALNWSQNYSVGANQTVIIDLPPVAIFGSEKIENKSIHITAQDNISVYAIHKMIQATEAAMVIPVSSLSSATSYIVHTKESPQLGGGLQAPSQFLIIAFEDDTQLTIVPATNTRGKRPKGVPFQVTLQRGQAYQVQDTTRSPMPLVDMTGSLVNGNKPFALFSGVASKAVVCAAQQHLYEQNYPVSTWGREYIITPYALSTRGYVYRVLASENNTVVKVHVANKPTEVITLQRGEFFETNVEEDVAFEKGIYINAQKPISVSQFMKGSVCNGINFPNAGAFYGGDPNMLLLNPNNQAVRKTVFNTVSTPDDEMNVHYLNLVVRTSDIATIKLQGVFLSPTHFVPVETCVGYSYAQINLSNYGIIDPVLGKSFTVESDNSFIGYAYGFGKSSSYAYSVGSNFEKIDYDYTASAQSVCLGEAITFNGSGTNISSYTWDFGDGSPTQTGQQVTHTFQQVGKYQVKMMVTIPNNFNQHYVVYEYDVYDMPKPELGAEKTVCVGNYVTLDAGVQGIDWQYEWRKNGNVIAGQIAKTLTINEVGIYQVMVRTPKNCIGFDEVTVANFPVIDARIIGIEEKYTLQTNAVPLQGLPTGGIFTINQVPTTSIVPQVLGLGEHTVIYTYTDVHGCVSKDSAKFSIFNPLTIFDVPNSFTPNGDGLNDEFRIFGDNFVSLDMRVYNRWGEVIFIGNSKEKTWNGIVNDKPAPAGVYAYTIRYQERYTKQWHIKQGYIHLIR